MTAKTIPYSIIGVILTLFTSCSMTKGLPEDDQLFTGLKKITWTDAPKESPYQSHVESTMDEVEAALATEPNGSIFGSSYHTVPWSWHLWVYNKYAGKDSKFAKWMTKSFGKAPVLMSKVNPTLRVISVGMSPTRSSRRRIPRSARSAIPSPLIRSIPSIHCSIRTSPTRCRHSSTPPVRRRRCAPVIPSVSMLWKRSATV